MEKIIMDIIEELGNLQIDMVNETGEDTSEFIGFINKSEDIWVINPFYDTTLRFKVDPIKEYGDEFLNSDFIKIAKKYLNNNDDDVKKIAMEIFNKEVKRE